MPVSPHAVYDVRSGIPSSRRFLIDRLLQSVWPRDSIGHRLRFVVALTLSILAQLVAVGAPLLYKGVLDALHAPITAVPILLIVAYGIARVTGQLSQSLRQLVFAPVIQRMVRATAVEVFRHLHDLSLGFHLDRRTGGLSRTLERGMAAMTFLIEMLFFSVAPVLIELALVACVVGGFYDLRYVVVIAVTIGSYVGFTAYVSNRQLALRCTMNDADVAANVATFDSILNYETIKYFGAEDIEVRRIDVARRAQEGASIGYERSRAFLGIGQTFLVVAGSTVIMLMAGEKVATGQLTIGDFVLLNTYLLQLYAPIGALALVYTSIEQSKVDVEALRLLLEQVPEVTDRTGAQSLPLGPGYVRFDQVSFHYDEARPILRDISFDIPPGHSVALVGTSGGGKSTIVRLLFRFYDVTSGAITIDGQDIRDVTQSSLRGAIGVVPQDTMLFNNTLEANIGYGRADASLEEVRHAAEIAHIDETIRRKPAGYGTQVGERGLKLSGGERQRIAIARVVLKDPPILVFDEATSSLDTRTERGIQDRLRAIASGRTTLIVAHRLSTIIDVDEILVIGEGRIVEQGVHRDLLARGGVYAAMWNKQRDEDNEG